MAADRDRAYLEALAGAADVLSPRAEPVTLSTRQLLGQSVAAARQLARFSRADLARGLGVDEQVIANLESGSIPLTRGA